MKTATLVALLAFVTSGGVGARQGPGGQEPPPAFRTGVDIVSLNVTVTDARRQYVGGLGAGDFEVFEDGVRQEVISFTSRQQPIALSLLLDSSASMLLAMPTLQEAATNFVRRLTPQDLAQVVDFDTQVSIGQEFTPDHGALESAIRDLQVGGSTSLYTALYVALKELRRIQAFPPQEVRRQAIIVFSDGDDTSSLVAFDDLLDLAKRSQTGIYTILLRGGDLGLAGYSDADFVMRQLAADTGGRAFSPARIQDLSGAYAQIAEELSHQYTLGYVSTNPGRNGAWRRITVQVRHGGAAVRTRRGYYAPTGP